MRPEKANIVKDLKDQLNASPFLLVADYTGLKVDQFAELKIRCRKAELAPIAFARLHNAVGRPGPPQHRGRQFRFTGDQGLPDGG